MGLPPGLVRLRREKTPAPTVPASPVPRVKNSDGYDGPSDGYDGSKSGYDGPSRGSRSSGNQYDGPEADYDGPDEAHR